MAERDKLRHIDSPRHIDWEVDGLDEPFDDADPFFAVPGLLQAAAIEAEGIDPEQPQFTDHYFTGDYPTRLLDREIAEGRNTVAERQLSFLVDA